MKKLITFIILVSAFTLTTFASNSPVIVAEKFKEKYEISIENLLYSHSVQTDIIIADSDIIEVNVKKIDGVYTNAIVENHEKGKIIKIYVDSPNKELTNSELKNIVTINSSAEISITGNLVTLGKDFSETTYTNVELRQEIDDSEGESGGGSDSDSSKDKEDEKEVIFKDLEKSHWAYKYIMDMVDKGIFEGNDKGEFNPNDNITRTEFLKVIASIEDNELKSSTKNPFDDVSQDDWYYEYILWAYDNGITKGVSDSTFAPNDYITRQDLAVLLSRYAEISNTKLEGAENYEKFNDHDKIAQYAVEAVYLLKYEGIINGVGDNNFSPEKTATRAETAKIISLYLEKN